jgi:valyl-tRNA synthetase
MSEKRVEGYRHFINKLWNAARFSLMHIQTGYASLEPGNLSLADRWILSRLNTTATSVAESLDNYRFNDAAGTLYQFVWHEFCDWYLEAIKPALYGNLGEDRKAATLNVLWHVLKESLILLHPFIPFVTEEIWHKLPGTEGSVMQASYLLDRLKSDTLLVDAGAEGDMNTLMEAVTGIRNVRGEMNISPAQILNVMVQSGDEKTRCFLESEKGIIANLAKLGGMTITEAGEKPKSSAAVVIPGAVIYVLLEGIIDIEKEVSRLEKEVAKIGKELTQIQKKLNNDDFLKKAKADVEEKDREKQDAILENQQKQQAKI